MHLLAALVPPPHVLDHLLEVVKKVRAPVDAAAADQPGRHLAESNSIFHRRHPAATATAARPMDWVAHDELHLLVARFGNLNLNEGRMLGHRLQREAPGWPAPQLRLSGGVALGWPGDRSAWVGVTGDLDVLEGLAEEVPQVALEADLTVDPWTFRPLVRLGTINDDTTAPYLEELVAALESYEGPEWSQTVMSLVVAEDDSGRPTFTPFRDAELGPPLSQAAQDRVGG